MKVGVDYRLASQHLGGMRVYVKNFVKLLKKTDTKNDYYLLENDYNPPKNFREKIWRVIQEQVWIQIELYKIFKTSDFGIGLFPNPPVPFFLKVSIILTIPDMAFFYDKEMYWWVKLYLWVIYYLSAHKAAVVVTFSQNSKNDIKKILNLKSEKIIIVPLAPSRTIQLINDKEKINLVQKRYGINKTYILSVPGTFVPRKNIVGLIKAFASLPKEIKNKLQLVIVGKIQGTEYDKAKSLSVKLDIDKDVIFTDRVEGEELSCLYSGAKIFVCPSLYEGFGLPPLEAMKCGIPVIAYDNSSLPEIIGDAGILVKNSDQLIEAITKLLSNRKAYTELVEKGFRRSKLFSWEKSVSLLKNIIYKFSQSAYKSNRLEKRW